MPENNLATLSQFAGLNSAPASGTIKSEYAYKAYASHYWCRIDVSSSGIIQPFRSKFQCFGRRR